MKKKLLQNGFGAMGLVVLVAVLGLVVLGVGVLGMATEKDSQARRRGFKIMQNRVANMEQPVERQAEVKDGQVSLMKGNGQTSGKSVPVVVSVKPGQEPISGIAMRLKYDGGSNAGLGVSSFKIYPDLLNDSKWMCPVNQTKVVNGVATVDIACAYLSTSGYVANGSVKLGEFTLTRTNGEFGQPVSLMLDPGLSVMTRKLDGKNVLVNQEQLTVQ